MDELERRIRAADPAQTKRDAPLSARAQEDLVRIISGRARPLGEGRPSAAPKRSLIYWASGIAAVLVIALVITVTNLGLQPASSLASPPRLKASPLGASLSETLERLSMAASKKSNGEDELILAESWSADITVDTSKTVVAVQPQEIERSRADDLSGSVVVRTGQVRWGDPEAKNAATPGAVLERYDYKAGEYPLLFTSPPPSTAPELSAYLQATLGLDANASTGEIFDAVQDLRNDWNLSGPRAAALLDLVRTLPDVELLGSVTDRLDRAGIAVQARSGQNDAFQTILVFAEDSGALLSVERVYLGGAKDVAVPKGTVVSYTAWKDRK